MQPLILTDFPNIFPNQPRDSTAGIRAALAAAANRKLICPAATYQVRRQGSETPILPLPSGITLEGEGYGTCFRYHPSANDTDG